MEEEDFSGMDVEETISTLALAMVREYLALRGLQTTLDTLHAELPVRPKPTRRSTVAKALGLQALVKKNKKRERPYATLVEVLADHLYAKRMGEAGVHSHDRGHTHAHAHAHAGPHGHGNPRAMDRTTHAKKRSGSSANSNSKDEDAHEDEDGDEDSQNTKRETRTKTKRKVKEEKTKNKRKSSHGDASRRGDETGAAPARRQVAALQPEVSVSSRVWSVPLDQKPTAAAAAATAAAAGAKATATATATALASSVRHDVGMDPVATGSFDRELPRHSDYDRRQPHRTHTSQHNQQASQHRQIGGNAASAQQHEVLVYDFDDLEFEESLDELELEVSESHVVAVASGFAPASASTTAGSTPLEAGNLMPSAPNNAALGASLAQSVPSEPLDMQTAFDLRQVVFNQHDGHFPESFLKQAFGFNVVAGVPSLRFGLWQLEGGPCGVLAAVQAFVVRELLFTNSAAPADSAPHHGLLDPTDAERDAALVTALAEILWNAGDAKGCKMAMCDASLASRPSSFRVTGGMYKPDGLTERVRVYSFTALPTLKSFINVHLAQLKDHSEPSVALYVYSLVLSRGIINIQQDRDGAWASMIGSHGYCSQELVNLALTGRATSNVFNGEKRLEEIVMHGVAQQAGVGLLSLDEARGLIEVGSNYKQPAWPIWVVSSESHYTMLFGFDRELSLSGGAAPSQFELYYYDMLANQDEEIRLTVDTSPKPFQDLNPDAHGLVPPLNQCIRTKWADARVVWHSSEPIL